jgi:hypothetical protein
LRSAYVRVLVVSYPVAYYNFFGPSRFFHLEESSFQTSDKDYESSTSREVLYVGGNKAQAYLEIVNTNMDIELRCNVCHFYSCELGGRIYADVLFT